MDHALNHLMHNFREKDGSFDGDRAPQIGDEAFAPLFARRRSGYSSPDHAEADPDGFRYFPSGSVGIPPVNALYMALAYDYAQMITARRYLWKTLTFWCLMGDSEFREGSLMEAMPDAGDRQSKRVVRIVDYNRQNLDGTRIINEDAMGCTDAERILMIAKANGLQARPVEARQKIRPGAFQETGR
jgi:pyruvate dehydrogenase E1 component